MSLFDPVSLLNADFGALDTKRQPLPIGEVVAQITEIGFSEGVSNKPGKPATPWNRLDAKLEITDPSYLSQYGDGSVDRITTNLGIMLDCTGLLSQGGTIQTGMNKNIRLGRLRDAAGVNGKPLGALVGQFIRISIIQKPGYNNPSEVVDEIANFTKA
jgi:hypothetical protein